jgi:hypothetical protein
MYKPFYNNLSLASTPPTLDLLRRANSPAHEAQGPLPVVTNALAGNFGNRDNLSGLVR